VLLDIARQVGLSVDAAREVLEKRTFKEAVDADWKLSGQYGITGVPTFVAGRHGVVGAQPYEALRATGCKAPRRRETPKHRLRASRPTSHWFRA